MVLFTCNKVAFGALGSFRYAVIMCTKELMQQAGDLGDEIRPCSLCHGGLTDAQDFPMSWDFSVFCVFDSDMESHCNRAKELPLAGKQNPFLWH